MQQDSIENINQIGASLNLLEGSQILGSMVLNINETVKPTVINPKFTNDIIINQGKLNILPMVRVIFKMENDPKIIIFDNCNTEPYGTYLNQYKDDFGLIDVIDVKTINEEDFICKVKLGNMVNRLRKVQPKIYMNETDIHKFEECYKMLEKHSEKYLEDEKSEHMKIFFIIYSTEILTYITELIINNTDINEYDNLIEKHINALTQSSFDEIKEDDDMQLDKLNKYKYKLNEYASYIAEQAKINSKNIENFEGDQCKDCDNSQKRWIMYVMIIIIIGLIIYCLVK